MIFQNKYLILPLSDIKAYLVPAEIEVLHNAVRKVQNGRTGDNKKTNQYFTLHLADPFARAAVEAYIAAAEQSDDKNNSKVKATLNMARDLLQYSRFATEERLPD